jgi:tripartite-type tricarboxylate transporter receptor subunit TctC
MLEIWAHSWPAQNVSRIDAPCQCILPGLVCALAKDAMNCIGKLRIVQQVRTLGRLVCLLALGASFPGLAQDYPARSVRIIVPFAPGGPADIYARFIGQRLQETLGQTFVVDNRPGAGSIIGTDAVAKSAPDGYTLLLMSNTHTVNESLIPNKPFQLLRDFEPVAPINYSDLVLVTRADLAVSSLGDLLRLAKAKPGGMSYASSGPGTPYHMAGELFKAMAGVDIVHVPYKGSSGARTDLLGGQLEMMFDAIPTMVEHIRSGKVKALGTSGKARSAVLPDVPTISEAGVPGYEATIWLGLMAPKNTPAPIVARLNAEIGRIVGQAEVQRAWGAQGATPMRMGVEEFGRYLHDDIAKWARIVKLSGATSGQ